MNIANKANLVHNFS